MRSARREGSGKWTKLSATAVHSPAMPETELEVAERRVREMEHHIAQQRGLADDIEAAGYEAAAQLARKTLAALEQALSDQAQRLARLRRKS
jgi:hypothetical protein